MQPAATLISALRFTLSTPSPPKYTPTNKPAMRHALLPDAVARHGVSPSLVPHDSTLCSIDLQGNIRVNGPLDRDPPGGQGEYKLAVKVCQEANRVAASTCILRNSWRPLASSANGLSIIIFYSDVPFRMLLPGNGQGSWCPLR